MSPACDSSSVCSKMSWLFESWMFNFQPVKLSKVSMQYAVLSLSEWNWISQLIFLHRTAQHTATTKWQQIEILPSFHTLPTKSEIVLRDWCNQPLPTVQCYSLKNLRVPNCNTQHIANEFSIIPDFMVIRIIENKELASMGIADGCISNSYSRLVVRRNPQCEVCIVNRKSFSKCICAPGASA